MSRKKPLKGGYEVGYGKPPKATRFQKGRSGNPSGRRKGRLNVATIVDSVLSQKISGIEGGRRVQRHLLEVLIRTWAAKAAQGDMRAIERLVELYLRLLSESEVDTPSSAPLSEDLADLLRGALGDLGIDFDG
jgi:hypothetical protein